MDYLDGPLPASETRSAHSGLQPTKLTDARISAVSPFGWITAWPDVQVTALIVAFLLTNNPDKFTEHTEVIHRFRINRYWLELGVH